VQYAYALLPLSHFFHLSFQKKVAMLVECLGFHFGRSAQMKPAPQPEPNAPPNPLDPRVYDPKARTAWSTPSKAFCGGDGSPPSMLWDRFIGEKVQPKYSYF